MMDDDLRDLLRETLRYLPVMEGPGLYASPLSDDIESALWGVQMKGMCDLADRIRLALSTAPSKP